MPTVRIEHTVADFEKWKEVFDNDPADRKGSGVRRYQVFQALDDPNYALIDLDFESLDEAEAFLRTMEQIWGGPAKAVMTNPRSRVLERVEERRL